MKYYAGLGGLPVCAEGFLGRGETVVFFQAL
jgi:hypothetical protein